MTFKHDDQTPSPTAPTRRTALQSAACGFGYLAWAGLCGEAQAGAPALQPQASHHQPKAKRVIFLFMHGGVSQVDSMDYKPRLQKSDGEQFPGALPANLSKNINRKMMASPWPFAKRGQCGRWMSDLFPHIAQHADDLCVINSMHTKGQSHGQAVMMLHTGSDSLVRPSMGSWVGYGLGSSNENLPGFVTISPPRGHGGVRNYGAAFLPAAFQGTAIGRSGGSAKNASIRYLDSQAAGDPAQRQQLALLQEMNREHLARRGDDARIEGVIESFELAFRMQQAAPQVLDMTSEPKHILERYGVDQKPTDNFARQCIMARRFAEAGVRYIQVSTPYKWDQHGNLKGGHQRNADEVDQPIAALLGDLKQRGMLDDTLVVFATEFGRTPITQGSNGRDHNPQGFSVWLAGGGVKPGHTHGATDDFGYHAIQGKVHMHDLHATILHLMGLDHQRLTYRYAGRDFRLTDVYGHVVREILA